MSRVIFVEGTMRNVLAVERMRATAAQIRSTPATGGRSNRAIWRIIVSVAALSMVPSARANGASVAYFALPTIARRLIAVSIQHTPVIIPTTARRAVASSLAEKNF